MMRFISLILILFFILNQNVEGVNIFGLGDVNFGEAIRGKPNSF